MASDSTMVTDFGYGLDTDWTPVTIPTLRMRIQQQVYGTTHTHDPSSTGNDIVWAWFQATYVEGRHGPTVLFCVVLCSERFNNVNYSKQHLSCWDHPWPPVERSAFAQAVQNVFLYDSTMAMVFFTNERLDMVSTRYNTEDTVFFFLLHNTIPCKNTHFLK